MLCVAWRRAGGGQSLTQDIRNRTISKVTKRCTVADQYNLSIEQKINQAALADITPSDKHNLTEIDKKFNSRKNDQLINKAAVPQ